MNRILLFLCLISSFSYAQTSETIRSGRPGNASGAFTTGKNIFQIENGTFGYSDFEKRAVIGNSFYARYGIAEKFEVNLITDISWGPQSNNMSYGGPNLGVKYNWLDNHADRISFGSLLSHNFGSLYNKGLNETTLNNIFVLNVTEKFGINFNNKVVYLGESKTFASWIIFNGGYTLSKRNTVYVEGSHYFSNPQASFIRLGWYKILNDDFQIDASVRFDQVDGNFPKRFYPGISVGFAKRFVPN